MSNKPVFSWDESTRFGSTNRAEEAKERLAAGLEKFTLTSEFDPPRPNAQRQLDAANAFAEQAETTAAQMEAVDASGAMKGLLNQQMGSDWNSLAMGWKSGSSSGGSSTTSKLVGLGTDILGMFTGGGGSSSSSKASNAASTGLRMAGTELLSKFGS